MQFELEMKLHSAPSGRKS